MAKLEQTAAKKKIVETCAGLSLQLIWRLVDYTTSTTGHVLHKSLPITAKQITNLYITTLESNSEYCTNYLHSSPRTVADILTRLVPDPPETTSRTTAASTNDTANESTLFKYITDTLNTFYPQVSSTHQAQLDTDRTKRQAESAFNARYTGQ